MSTPAVSGGGGNPAGAMSSAMDSGGKAAGTDKVQAAAAENADASRPDTSSMVKEGSAESRAKPSAAEATTEANAGAAGGAAGAPRPH